MQHANYSYLGKKELSNYEIYSILESPKNYLFIATNYGVVKYGGYTFKKLKQASNIPTSSFFNLKLRNDGKIFCSNLYGQILTVKGDSLTVYFQDPSKGKALNPTFSFTKNNNLLVLGASLYWVNKKYVKKIYELPYSNLACSRLFHEYDSTVSFYYNNIKINITDDTTVNVTKTHRPDTYLINVIELNDTLFYFDQITSNLLTLKKEGYFVKAKKQLNNNKQARYVTIGNEIAVLNNSFGASFFNHHQQPVFEKKTLVNQHFISTAYKDLEGNYLLGTFGSGIIVIPNRCINTHDEQKFPFKQIEGVNDKMYACNANNELFVFDKKMQATFVKKTNSRITNLVGISNQETLLVDAKHEDYIINTTNNFVQKGEFASIKDGAGITKKELLIATNKGVFHTKKGSFSSSETVLNNRTNILVYDSINKIIYAHNVNGFFVGSLEEFKQKKVSLKNINVSSVLTVKGITYVAVKNQGLYVYKGAHLLTVWNKKNGFDLANIKQIETDGVHLYLIQKSIVLKLNLASKNIVGTISESNGFSIENATDFAIWNNRFFSVSDKGLQSIFVDSIKEELYTPKISIKTLKVNDSLVNLSEHTFNYKQTKFEFIVESPSIKYREEIVYEYKLAGVDKTFQYNNYQNNVLLYKSLSPGNYSISVRAKWRNNFSDFAQYNFTITPPFWSTWWFVVIIIVVLGSTTFFLLDKRIKQIKLKNELKNELNLSKLIAVQSQMNPHFIFNAISSIQNLILDEKTEESYNYIVKFSTLVRQTLNFSNKEFVSFKDEISLLNVYLEIEKLRFQDDFKFIINTNNITDIMLPPMLVQPFIENAIKHGLLHKKGGKTIHISFSLEKTLVCKVRDNGIGREASAKIKARQNRKHESFSTSATAKRLAIMNEHYEQKVFFYYIDLLDNNEAIGTEVIINMPFREC